MSAILAMTDVLPEKTSTEWTEPFTLSVPKGTWTVIRTTPERSHRLARVLTGSIDISQGELVVLGRPIGKVSRIERRLLLSDMGVLLDPPGLLSNLTLIDNLVVPAVFRGSKGISLPREHAVEVFAELGITDYADRRPADVPEDVRQLGAIGRALVGNPRLLVLENPLASVRSRAAGDVWRICRALAPTAIITTFRRDEMLYNVADDLYLWDSAGLRRAAVEASA